MSSRATSGAASQRPLGRATVDLGAVRADARPRSDADSPATILARRALVDAVCGCAVCLIEGGETVRVAGVAGDTGTVTSGSRWPLAASPVSEILAGTDALCDVDAGSSPLGRALHVGANGELVALPLRIGRASDGEPTSLGALLLVRDRTDPLTVDDDAFLREHAALVTLAMLGAGPAQDWAWRARRLRSSVDIAVELAGSLDTGEVIPRVLARTCEALDATRAALISLQDDEVVVEGVHDPEGATASGWRGPLAAEPVLLEAMRSGQVVVAGHQPRDHLRDGLHSALGDVSHTMVLSIRADTEPAGFIAVGRRHPRPFIHDDSVTLELLGQVAMLALRNARLFRDAQATSEAMSSLLNLVVHDLRAPLTVLSGYIDLLRDGTFGTGPAAWKKPMEMVASKLSETHRLVDDILLTARMEGGAIPVAIERIDLNDVIVRAAARSEARARLANASIETSPHAKPVTVAADVFQVDRIVDNLINNAMSYGGPAPWIRLSVDASQPPAIRVEDHGTGISPEFHSRIFDRFFRIDDRLPGTGFGLHVGRVLAEAGGGSLQVERSLPGEGSVFRLELPSAAAAS